jgi:hypothetical protein
VCWPGLLVGKASILALVVWFLYGGMIWGLLPIRPGMSWELHLSGAILGVALAIAYRRWDVTPVKRYAWEDDDSVPEWFPQKENATELNLQDVTAEEAETRNIEQKQNDNDR